jgi:hypothetical protein
MNAISKTKPRKSWRRISGATGTEPIRSSVAIQRRLLRKLFKQVHPEHQPASNATIEAVRARLARGTSVGTYRLAGICIATSGGRITVSVLPTISGERLTVPSHDAMRIVSPALGEAPVTVEWTGTGQRIQVQLIMRQDLPQPARSQDWSMVVDADRVSGPLTIRSWRVGDRFLRRPQGPSGPAALHSDSGGAGRHSRSARFPAG